MGAPRDASTRQEERRRAGLAWLRWPSQGRASPAVRTTKARYFIGGPAAAGAPVRADLPSWSTSRFTRTQEHAEREEDPKRKLLWLAALAGRRPWLSLAIYVGIAGILTLDTASLLRRAHEFQALSVAIDMMPAPVRSRLMALRPNVDRIHVTAPAASPVPEPGSRLAPLATGTLLDRPASIRGVLTPRESAASKGEEAVPLSASLPAPAVLSSNPSSIAVAKAPEQSKPATWLMVTGDPTGLPPVYSPEPSDSAGSEPSSISGAAGRAEPQRAGAEEEPGEEGPDAPEDLVQATEGFSGAADDDALRDVPDNLRGDDLLDAVLGRPSGQEQNWAAFRNYAGQRWNKVRKIGPHYQSPDPNLARVRGRGLRNSQSIIQLAETAVVTAGSYFCTSCAPESRINNNRSTYFGEPYKKVQAVDLK